MYYIFIMWTISYVSLFTYLCAILNDLRVNITVVIGVIQLWDTKEDLDDVLYLLNKWKVKLILFTPNTPIIHHKMEGLRADNVDQWWQRIERWTLTLMVFLSVYQSCQSPEYTRAESTLLWWAKHDQDCRVCTKYCFLVSSSGELS